MQVRKVPPAGAARRVPPREVPWHRLRQGACTALQCQFLQELHVPDRSEVALQQGGMVDVGGHHVGRDAGPREPRPA